MGRNLCQVSEPFSGLARGQSFVHGSVPASRSRLASGIKGRLGSGAELGRKVAKGLSLVFWCLKLVNKVGKGFFSSWYLFWCIGSSPNASLQGARWHAGRLTHEDGSNVCSSSQSCSCPNTT